MEPDFEIIDAVEYVTPLGIPWLDLVCWHRGGVEHWAGIVLPGNRLFLLSEIMEDAA